MAEDEFDYDDLVNARDAEASSKQLSSIPDDFYEDLRRYIQDLDERVSEIGLPETKRERLVHKEFKQVKKIADDFFKKRQRKIVLAAYHDSLGENVDMSRMVDRELDLFENITSLLKELKEEVFFGGYKRKAPSKKEVSEEEKEKTVEEDVEQGLEEGLKKKTSDTEELETGEKTETIDIREEEGGEKKEKEKKEESEGGTEKTIEEEIEEKKKDTEEPESFDELLIRITEDMSPFIGLRDTYELRKEDVLTMREDLANVLIERGKAEKVKL